MKEFDVVIVGAGIAGMRAAIGAVKRNLRVAVITKVHPLRSPGVAADEGLNAVLENEDSKTRRDLLDMHSNDTHDCGYRFSDDEAVETMVQRAPAVIGELERWGCPLSLEKNNTYSMRRMGASSRPRNIHIADQTGHAVLYTLYEQCVRLRRNKPENLRFFEEWFVLKLLVSNNTAAGVIAMQFSSGKMEKFRAKSIIWASGGSGRIYGNTSNPLTSSGWGLAVPVFAGVTLKDMEFVQFNPTQLTGSHIQVTEAARGEGALLLNRKGERFLASYNDSGKGMELSAQDVICRNIFREILAGRGIDASSVYLDMRTTGKRKISKALPFTRELCRKHAGADPVSQLISVRPGQSYFIGGIHTNEKAESDIDGLFAAGECANPGVHGANVCEGNQLTETLVFAEIAAESAAKYISRHHNKKNINETLFRNAFEEEKQKLQKMVSVKGEIRSAVLRNKMQQIMDRHAGVFRDGMGLVEAAKSIRELKKLFHADLKIDSTEPRANFGLIDALELKGSLEIAEIILQAALSRNESIGVHFRNDFPSARGRHRHSLTRIRKTKIKIRYTGVKSRHKWLKEISPKTLIEKL